MLRKNFNQIVESVKEANRKHGDTYFECDHPYCNARALFRFTFTTGHLDFCGHHTKQHKKQLYKPNSNTPQITLL